MINRLQLLRNVGQFDSVDSAANIAFSRLTLIYAENGRGKTTIAAILRSLGTNDPVLIAERKRLGAANPPHVVLDCDGGPPAAVFKNGVWNRSLDNIVVFDDLFVHQNVYSGLDVEIEHRRGLHELILGAQGVILNRELQQRVSEVETHIRALAAKRTAIPVADRGTLTVDEFCALAPQSDIGPAIEAAERALAAARAQAQIGTSLRFDELSLPPFDIAAIETILQRGLPELAHKATACVQAHFSKLGIGAEDWVADGMSRFGLDAIPSQFSQENMPNKVDVCPFCAQSLAASALISHYRDYFGAAYTELKRDVSEAIDANERTHGGDARTVFERAVRIAVERRQVWSRFCGVPEIALDTAVIAEVWEEARSEMWDKLQEKHDRPLEQLSLPARAKVAIGAYESLRQTVAALSVQLQQANGHIRAVKAGAATADTAALETDLARLKAIWARHAPATAVLCQAYLDERSAKTLTEGLRDRARDALDGHRTTVFPAYEARVNHYLQQFAAGFRLQSVVSDNTRGGLTCVYNVIINNTTVPVTGGTPAPGEPSFRNTLSSGDRNTLALAFFFTSLDQDAALANKIVVIDDPMTSLDEHRSLTTVQEVRALATRARQVIVLSHSKTFLCNIWRHANRQACATLTVVESTPGSTINAWGINDDCASEYDHQHTRLREYQPGNAARSRLVAQDLRHVLEGFLRRCCPAHFLPGEVLGDLRRKIRDQPPGSTPILSAPMVAELDAICEYANKFHHNPNAACETEIVNETELGGWVRRTLAFICK
jgi:hypothetical protein